MKQREEAAKKAEGETVAIPASQRETILIVEDDKTTRELIAELVSEDHPDLHIETASDGLEALSKIAERVPSILITNIVMSRMDGIELLKTLHKKGITLPTIVTSGHWKPEAFEEWLTQEGISRKEEFLFLRKPFRLEQVQTWLEKVRKGKLGGIEHN